MMTAILELRGVSRHFGGLRAVNDVTLSVPQGRIMGLIGPNGAGKTTLVNLITGMIKLSAGEMWFKGARIDGLAPHRISRLGIARTFQIVQPFPEMTALENVAAAAMFAGNIASQSEARDFAESQLERVGLLELRSTLASRLSLGQRKRLEFAKSLAMKPSILLLDEVNAGLHGGELAEAITLIRSLAQDGLTILIIEHLMKVVVSLCDDLAVLHHGELIANGPAQQVMGDEHVIKAYLGERYLKRQRAG
ncbi:MAG: lptB 10 [Xanthobacteraceae bacterium]|nr:lptB 10 [Xanthobacteraceae bacterium]